LSLEIGADTPDAVTDAFLFPDICPICHAWDGRTDDEQCRLAAEEFANATPEQRDAVIEMVRQAGQSIRGYWMGQMLGSGTVEYEDMSGEQKRIVDAGDEVAGKFPIKADQGTAIRVDMQAVQSLTANRPPRDR